MGSPRSPVDDDDDGGVDDGGDGDDGGDDGGDGDDDGDDDDDGDNLKADSRYIGHPCRLRHHRVVGNLTSS